MFNVYRGQLDLTSSILAPFISNFKHKINTSTKNNLNRDVKKLLYFYNNYSQITNPITIFATDSLFDKSVITFGPSPGNTRLLSTILLNLDSIDSIILTSSADNDKNLVESITHNYEEYNNVVIKPLNGLKKFEVSVPEHFDESNQKEFTNIINEYYRNHLLSFNNTKWIDNNSNTIFQTGDGSKIVKVADRVSFFENFVKEIK
jgi:hypothetical protein